MKKKKQIPAWLEEYKKQEKLAIRRATRLPDNWYLYLPKSQPRNEKEAQKRIEKFKNVSIKKFKEFKAPDYVRHQVEIKRPGKIPNYQSIALTQKQYREAEQAQKRKQKVEKERGLEPSPDFKNFFGSMERYKEFLKERATESAIHKILDRYDNQFIDNFIQSMEGNIESLELYDESGDIDFTIKQYRMIIAFMQAHRKEGIKILNNLHKTYGGDFTNEIFGSDQVSMSPVNIVRLLEGMSKAGVLAGVDRSILIELEGNTIIPERSKFVIRAELEREKNKLIKVKKVR